MRRRLRLRLAHGTGCVLSSDYSTVRPARSTEVFARLAGELLGPNVNAIDDRACHQVAVDAVGIAAGGPQAPQPGMHRAQMRLYLGRANRRAAIASKAPVPVSF